MSLQFLIAEAAALGGGDLCASGHDWKPEGGRYCFHSDKAYRCYSAPFYAFATQTVFRCTRCGAYDYGDNGGPGHAECVERCGLP
jgi:hypothetical protein